MDNSNVINQNEQINKDYNNNQLTFTNDLKTSPIPQASTNGEDIDTGVSNGDVDWLFRGKSKKLVKKMNNNVNPEIQKEKDKLKESKDSKSNTITTDDKETVNKSSKLDKLKVGRSRSSSTSSVTQQQQQQQQQQQVKPKRSSSFNFMTPSLTSDLVYNDHESILNSQKDNHPPSQSSSTNSSPGVSRSNSGKKSLFSSLSSKFKSSSSSTSTPDTPISPKLNPNLIGSGSLNSKLNEDLVSLTNKPPIGSGSIPIKRRSSITSKLSSSPTFKESYQDSNQSNQSTTPPNNGYNFFRRKSSTINQNILPKQQPKIILNKNPNKLKLPIKELENIKLSRVTFAIDKLEYDPQQQIPSRKPKKGNVLIPQDINAPIPRLCLGISSDSNLTNSYTEREIHLAYEAQKRAIIEAEKHANEAHLQAKKIAQEVSQFKLNKSTNLIEEELPVTTDVDVVVDKPLHLHEQHFENEPETNNITLETIYTRCCHLREILPIPATLKQLKNKSAPLEVLKMLNPKPTLIDVLSFADFISIVEINTIIFDNVSINSEMLKIFLSSLLNNKYSLEKLSLRNVVIDNEGWSYLCKFLAIYKHLKKLDISQQRIKNDSDFKRSKLNWDLFINSIKIRGGIEELVINGCKLSDEIFLKLIDSIKNSTRRFGIANIDLNIQKAKIVSNWLIDSNSKCVGVDIASNDLSQGQLIPFINAFNQIGSNVDNLLYFSLNSTNLNNIEQVENLIKSMINLSSLRFLDLSSCPKIFPKIIPCLSKNLPKFKTLKRIHLDLNELSPEAIGSIAMILPNVPHLVHVSLLGNRNLTHSAIATIYSAIKTSNTIFALDLDYDLINDELSQRIAFYLMRNMDKSLKPEYSESFKTNQKEEEDLIFDGSLLMETAESILLNIEQGKSDYLLNQQIIANTMLQRTRLIRKDIHKTIDELFLKRKKNLLSFEGKENLVRICLLDNSLEKMVSLFEEHELKLSSNESNEKEKTPPIFQFDTNIDNLHQNSNEIINSGPILSPRIDNKNLINKNLNSNYSYFNNVPSNNLQPHQVVSEFNDLGESYPIDKLTGRPVLMKSISQTSLHAKEQEIEEGEFHKFGFFMQSKNNENNNHKKNSSQQLLNVIPSGMELRDAVKQAKGIENVDDLIDKINNNRISIDNIIQNNIKQKQQDKKQLNLKETTNEDVNDDDELDNTLINSQDVAVNPQVDEVYDKLLNDAEKVRSNK